RMNNVSSSTVDEDELLNIKGSSKFYEDIILFTKFDLKKSWRPGAVGQEITKYSQDKSWLLCELLSSVYKNGKLQRATVLCVSTDRSKFCGVHTMEEFSAID
ncbi:12797_t:CDS:2, partial [Dentiscutata heterogama]